MKKEISNSATVVYICETPSHGNPPKGIAEKMLSFSRPDVEGRVQLPRREQDTVVGCYGCRKAAEEAGLKAFPLSLTLRNMASRDAKIAALRAERKAQEVAYFRSLGAKAHVNGASGLLAAREVGRQEALQEQGELPPRGQARRLSRHDWRAEQEAARQRGRGRAEREATAM